MDLQVRLSALGLAYPAQVWRGFRLAPQRHNTDTGRVLSCWNGINNALYQVSVSLPFASISHFGTMALNHNELAHT